MKKTIRMAAMALSALLCFTAGAVTDPTYKVTVKEGTEDAGNWTIDPAAATNTGVKAGTTITAAYAGAKRVKSVKAKKVNTNPLAVPLTVEALTAGNIGVANPKDGMQYSKNGAAKTSEGIASIAVAAGDKVTFYGSGTSINNYSGTKIGGSGDGFTCKVYGNIMSLVDETGFATNKTLTASNAFKELFRDNIYLKDAGGLMLPAMTLTSNCYQGMFRGCNALTTAPELPATTLVVDCYSTMFYGCSALTNAPELKVKTLAESCYAHMFWDCSALTTAPELPATTLAYACYDSMFRGCTALTAAPELKAETLTENCYRNMFRDCSSLNSVTCLATNIGADLCTASWLSGVAASGTFTKAPSMAGWPMNNASGIPSGWTVEEE